MCGLSAFGCTILNKAVYSSSDRQTFALWSENYRGTNISGSTGMIVGLRKGGRAQAKRRMYCRTTAVLKRSDLEGEKMSLLV